MNSNYDAYYEQSANRSPTSQRQNSLHRQGSRTHFDPQMYLPAGLYTNEDYNVPRYDNRNFGDMRNATIGGYGGGYDMGGGSWNAGAFSNNQTLNGMGGQSLRKPPSRGGRSGLPSAWLDQTQSMHNNQMNSYAAPFDQSARHNQNNMEQEEELIPTALVIKNIPFSVKKEELVQKMTDLGLPLPYAFNYHFDNGVFRGLAFANFSLAEETEAVIRGLNHIEMMGRKLRVEYKKMLPAVERDRIEREKRERRGQLEEQHRPLALPALQAQTSTNSLSSRMMNHSPSPVSARNLNPHSNAYSGQPSTSGSMSTDVDMNDPNVLAFYSKLLIFKEDPTRDFLVFDSQLAPPERRIVHTIAHHMGLLHMSKGDGERRAVHVSKEVARPRISPPRQQMAHFRHDDKRGLSRAATTDFSDVRNGEQHYAGPRHYGSGYLAATFESTGGLGPGNNLRAAKSFADLRSWTPSPVPSTASFPAALRNNAATLQDFGRDPNSSNTPTIMTPSSSMVDRGESNIINGLGNMNLGAAPFGGSPRGLRGYSSWDREVPGAVGGRRTYSAAFEDRSQSRSHGTAGPERQPRGPLPERGLGFARPRQNGHMTRNSDELSQPSSAEITVE